jgi:26S proteasome regulatory subunit N7
VTSGKKIDASMAKVRVALFFMDLDTARTQIAASKALVEDGGDWDRRNRLKVRVCVCRPAFVKV